MQALINNAFAYQSQQNNWSNASLNRIRTDRFQPYPSITTTFNQASKILNKRIFDLIDEFATLEYNWDSDGALAITAKVINLAKSTVESLEKHNQPIYHAAPGPNGEIMIDIRNSETSKSVEIIFYSTKAVAVKFSNSENPQQVRFETRDLSDLLGWLNIK